LKVQFIIQFQEGDGVIIGDQPVAIGLSYILPHLSITQTSVKPMVIILLMYLGSLLVDYWLLVISDLKDIITIKINPIKV
jgi:hypothetical protein